MATSIRNGKGTEEAILTRVFRPHEADLSPDVARAILQFGFDEADRVRMHELVVKNQEAELSTAEKTELDNFRRVGNLVSILKAKARLSLKGTGKTRR